MTFPIASHLPFLRRQTQRLSRGLPAWDQEDIVQDTCVNVLSARATLSTPDTQRLYLYGCLVNVLKERRRAAHTAKRYGAEVSIQAMGCDIEYGGVFGELRPAHHPPALRSPPAQEHHVLLAELLRAAPRCLIEGGTHVQRSGPSQTRETNHRVRTRKLLRDKFRKDYAP